MVDPTVRKYFKLVRMRVPYGMRVSPAASSALGIQLLHIDIPIERTAGFDRDMRGWTRGSNVLIQIGNMERRKWKIEFKD